MEKRLKGFSGKALFFISCVLILAVSSGGCEPLRKKFRREKKKDKIVQEIPVLEPVDYPAETHTPQELYKQHYSLFQVWFKELIEAVSDQDISRKRQLYLLNQTILQLQEINNLMTEEKQENFSKKLDKLNRVKKDLEAPVSTRSMSSLVRELESLEKDLRDEYSFRNMQNSLKP